MNKTKMTIFCLLIFAGSILLSACGNKGPLYTTTQEDATTQENTQQNEEKKK